MLNAAVFCSRPTVGSSVSGAASTSQASARATAASPPSAKCQPASGRALRPQTPPGRGPQATFRRRCSRHRPCAGRLPSARGSLPPRPGRSHSRRARTRPRRRFRRWQPRGRPASASHRRRQNARGIRGTVDGSGSPLSRPGKALRRASALCRQHPQIAGSPAQSRRSSFYWSCSARYRLHRTGNVHRFREWVGRETTFFAASAVAA